MPKKPVKPEVPPKSPNPPPKAAVRQANHGNMTKILALAGLASVLLTVIFLRIRLLDIPLERDEGEYALMGQLILKGIPPYEMAYNMKLPGTYYMYALLMAVFGQTGPGVHLGLLVVNLGCIGFLFLIGRALADERLGLLAAAAYALLSILPNYFGFAAHATHFNAVFALLGLWALLSYRKRPTLGWLVLTSLGFGLSFIMKQQAVFLLAFGFAAFAMVEWARTEIPMKKLTRIGTAGILMVAPYLLVFLSALLTGTFDQFVHWTIRYAGEYAGTTTWSRGMMNLEAYSKKLTNGVIGFWIIGIAGIPLALAYRRWRTERGLISAFFIAAFACVMPGLHFRPHYFVVFLPALALSGALVLHGTGDAASRFKIPAAGLLPFVLLAVLAGVAMRTHADYLFRLSPEAICRNQFGSSNPFIESRELGRFIGANTGPEDKVAILGSEPQIYFYADRLPATGFIYTYPLMENQRYSLQMQKDMIAEIEANRPKILLYVNSPLSWLRKEGSTLDIFNWHNTYTSLYNQIGIVDINPKGPSSYVWREALNGYAPQFDNRIVVYERLPGQ